MKPKGNGEAWSRNWGTETKPNQRPRYASACTEDRIIEQPATGLFGEFGWQVALPHAHPGPFPEGEGVWVTVSEENFRRVRSLLALTAGREPAGAAEQSRRTESQFALERQYC